MRNPNHITNPKTIRKYEKSQKEWRELVEFAKANGYKPEKRSTNCWSFSKDGVRSVYGFDTEYEVLVHIRNTHK